jgi:hypothetical protein
MLLTATARLRHRVICLVCQFGIFGRKWPKTEIPCRTLDSYEDVIFKLRHYLKNLEDKIDQLREARDKTAGWNSGVSAGWSVLLAVVGLILLAAGIFIGSGVLKH